MPEPEGRDRPQAGAIADELARIRSENARLLERMAEAESRFRLVCGGVVRVQEEERRSISRELHDGVGQSLTAIQIELTLLEQSLAGEESSLAPRVHDLRELVERTLQDVREIAHLLRPQMLDELGLGPTLRWFARTFEKRTGISVELVSEGLGEERIDPHLETLVYRMVQEGLTNAAKHAEATWVRVALRRAGGRLRLTIEDRGRGFDPAKTFGRTDEESGFGLRGMRDRARLFGGTFFVRSAPGEGTAVEAELPIGVESESA